MPFLFCLTTIGSWLRRPGQPRRKALGLALLGVCAAGSPVRAEAQGEPKHIRLSVEADEAEYSGEDATTSLSGHVRLRASDLPGYVPEVTIEADRVRLGLRTGETEAGPVATVTMPRLRLSAQDMRYNLRSQRFEAGSVRSVVQMPINGRELGIYGRSKHIEGTAGDFELRGTHLSTCDHDPPHYSLDVRRAQVRLDRSQLIIHNAGIRLWGMRVPLVSRYSLDLGGRGAEASGLSGIKLPGFSAVDGFYVPYLRRFSAPRDPIQAELDARLCMRHLISGTLAAEYAQPGFRVWAAAARHLESEDDVSQKLVHDALPEVGLEEVYQAGSSTYSARFLTGRYRDEIASSGWKETNEAATLRLDWNVVQRSVQGLSVLWAGAGVRGSVYGTGDSYRTLDCRAGVGFTPWAKAHVEVEYRRHFLAGHTPFEFDDVDLPSEACLVVSTPLTRNWSVQATGRYDLEQSELRDYTLDLARRTHCIIWHLNYRFVGSRFNFMAELADFARPRSLAAASRLREGPLPAVSPISPQRTRRPKPPRMAAPAQAELPAPAARTEFALAEGVHQRAPDPPDPLRRRPPPSLRLAYNPELQ